MRKVVSEADEKTIFISAEQVIHNIEMDYRRYVITIGDDYGILAFDVKTRNIYEIHTKQFSMVTDRFETVESIQRYIDQGILHEINEVSFT
jgi:hypothetical protein